MSKPAHDGIVISSTVRRVVNELQQTHDGGLGAEQETTEPGEERAGLATGGATTAGMRRRRVNASLADEQRTQLQQLHAQMLIS